MTSERVEHNIPSKPRYSILRTVMNRIIFSEFFMILRKFYLFQRLRQIRSIQALWKRVKDVGNTERSDFWTGSRERLRALAYGVDVEDEDEWAKTGDDYVGYILSELPEDPSPSWHALEIGCGSGRVLGQMQVHFDDIIGVDFSPDMVRYSSERFSDLTNVSILRNDGKTLPVEDESLDLVYSVLVFQHMNKESIESYFKEVHRALKPNRYFRFQTRWDVERRDSNYMDRYFLSREDIEAYADRFGFTLVNYQRGLGHEWFHWFTLMKSSER